MPLKDSTRLIIYAACGKSVVLCNEGGLMRSTNGGTNWTRVIGSGATCALAADLKINDIEESAGGDLWASSYTSATSTGKIWRSPAGATVGNAGTWIDKTPTTATYRRIELACSPTNNLRVYALCQGASGNNGIGGILRTDDGAASPASSWVNITNTTLYCDQLNNFPSTDFSNKQAYWNLTLAVKPDDDNTVFAGGILIMKTTTAGTPGSSWTQITQWAAGCGSLPNVHADIHSIQYLPGSTTEFVVTCDGGIFYTANGGNTFTAKNNNYNVTQYYSCAVNPTAGSNYMLGGAQDNGSHKFTTAGMNTVTSVSGGDGAFCFIDQKNPLQQVTSSQNFGLYISNNGGTSFIEIGGPAGVDRFINPGDLDTSSSTSPGLSTAALLYAGGAAGNFCRATINFSTQTATYNSFPITGATSNHSVSAIKIDPNTRNRVWIAMSTADRSGTLVTPQLYYFNNANTGAPVQNTIALPASIIAGQYISSIDVENGNASHILITISNYGSAGVYESTDLGASWTSLHSNLPDMPVRWGMFIPSGYNQFATSSAGGILLATELGVWGTNTISGATTTWAQNATGMGNVRADMLKLRGSDKMVAVATHGRGLFTAPLISVLPVDYVWFKGTPLANANQLSWKVSNSINNSGFEIERKYNGETQFTKIGFVPASNSSATSIEYGFDDKTLDLSKHVAIYRLKQIDINGTFKYSDQVPVKRSQVNDFILFVSAKQNNLLIRTGNKTGISKVLVQVYNSEGKTMLATTEKYQDMNIDISKLASGTYFIKITGLNAGEEYTTKFIK